MASASSNNNIPRTSYQDSQNLNPTLTTGTSAVAQVQEQVQSQANMLAGLVTELQGLQSQIQDVQDQLDTAKQTSQSLKAQINALNPKKDKDKIANLQNALNSQNATVSRLQNQLNDLEGKVADKKQQIEAVKNKLADLKNTDLPQAQAKDGADSRAAADAVQRQIDEQEAEATAAQQESQDQISHVKNGQNPTAADRIGQYKSFYSAALQAQSNLDIPYTQESQDDDKASGNVE